MFILYYAVFSLPLWLFWGWAIKGFFCCAVSCTSYFFISLFSFQDLQIISTDESQVFVAVQEWYQTDTYNLYQSDPQGVSYSIVLENVRSTKQPEENVLIDILEVKCLLLTTITECFLVSWSFLTSLTLGRRNMSFTF